MLALVAKRANETPDLDGLMQSWHLALRAERKSPETIKSYLNGVRQFVAWCEETGASPALTRANLTGFVVAMMDPVEDGGRGLEAATAVSRHLAVRRFSAWLLEEGEISTDELLNLRAPKIDVKVVDPLEPHELQALIKACHGSDLRDRRDEAIVRFMAECGARAGETAALGLLDVDLSAGIVTVRRGKGGKGRLVPIGPQTGRAIDRYLRLRKTHRLKDTPALWVGDRGKAFGYDALHKTLSERAEAAAITGFYPHRLRHTAADRWLDQGGSEGGLMAVAGWTRNDMLNRYTKRRSSIRAIDEARRLNLGDI